ncbi:MAG: argininosuccinate lyase [Cyclobacteriaceae bacterium]|nr:argininosuccinate lyase [Cyclobacteriaceae bacterium]
MKLWQKDMDTQKEVEAFTVGQDATLDLFLAKYDVLGSLAHIAMLESIGLLRHDEQQALARELKKIHRQIEQGQFQLEEGVEDVHSQVELLLTRALGDTGKKIHSGRSRNDQVLVDCKLFLREQLRLIISDMEELFRLLQAKSEQHRHALLPGYTHLQLAMPSSFGLWFGAYAESLVDDVASWHAAYTIVNKNPLGSAAGYGSSFPLNRTMTTRLLGFETLHYNVVYAQMSRGKTERMFAQAMANTAATLAKLAMDVTLYLNQNFAFISFPDELTTGSSIMPHKKNPDVFELIRGKCNLLQALPNDLALLTTNLPSGYHRDWQLLKEKLFPAIGTLRDCLRMTTFMLSAIHVRENILDDPRYRYLFSVEEVNRLVLQGVPFRDAYRQVGHAIAHDTFSHTPRVHHTHEGSIGNLCNAEVRALMQAQLERFAFATVDEALTRLLA